MESNVAKSVGTKNIDFFSFLSDDVIAPIVKASAENTIKTVALRFSLAAFANCCFTLSSHSNVELESLM